MPGVQERGWYRTGRTIAMLLRTLKLTLRFEVRHAERFTPPCVLALWHGRIIGSTLYHTDSGCVSMASQSNDGALAAGAIDGLGLLATRGSTSRGGREAIGAMSAALRSGAPFAALTVDGPKGPWRQVKPGVVVLARRLGLPVVPISFSCARHKMLRSWDHGIVPRPFARLLVGYGEPWLPERSKDGPSPQERIAASLEAITRELDREACGRELWPEPPAPVATGEDERPES
jgi:lysophospholipid acyltransferase (LPLAT)-like uncharacterized protein